MEQHPIPQNIMDVEFKLVGSLTLKQFGYCLIGSAIAIFAFTAPLPIYFKYPIIFFALVSGFLLAFFPMDDRSLDIWFFNFVKAIYKPQRRIWRKDPTLPYFLTLDVRAASRKKPTKIQDHRLQKYLATGDEEDEETIAPQSDILRINELFKSERVAVSTAPALIVPTNSRQTTPIPSIANKVITPQTQTLASKVNMYTQNVVPLSGPGDNLYYRTPITNVTTNRPPAPANMHNRPSPAVAPPRLTRQFVPNQANPTNPQPEKADVALARNDAMLTQIKSVMRDLSTYNRAGGQPIIDPNLFPASLKPPSQSQERIISKIAQANTKTLKNVAKSKVPTPPQNMIPAPPQVETLSKLSEQNDQILKELEQTRKQIQRMHSKVSAPPQQRAPFQQPPLGVSPTVIVEPQATATPVAPTADQLKTDEGTKTQQLIAEKENITRKNSPIPERPIAETTTFQTQPNILSGIVLTKSNERLGEAIVMVKDEQGIPQWAMRTNSSGEFKMSNQLPNGLFSVDIQKPGLHFTTINVTAHGVVIEPLIIKED